MKKRMLAMIFAAVMAFGAAGCGGGAAQEETENPVATEMQAELQSFAAELDAEAAAAEGMYTIKGGEVIGIAGRTGMATGDCLAFWVSQNGMTVDPLQFYNMDAPKFVEGAEISKD